MLEIEVLEIRGNYPVYKVGDKTVTDGPKIILEKTDAVCFHLNSARLSTRPEMSNKIRLAILGSRGIPATYGGFETITQELSVELAKKGFDVYVACESGFFRKNPFATYKAVKLVYFPIISSIRTISEVLYDALSIIWASFMVDGIYMLGYASIIALIFPKLLGKVVMVNVDGLEWSRRKFNRVLRFLLKGFEMLAVKIADYIVVDSHTIGIYYQKNYGIEPIYIPNGIREINPYSCEVLVKYGLEKHGYYLVVARLEPENNIDLIINGYEKSNSNKKLVIVGPIKKSTYVERLLRSKSERIHFLGGIYNKRLLSTLRHNSYGYIHGHEVGGTNPSLLESLSCCNAIIAVDVPFNREVADSSALYFRKDVEDLKNKIELIENDPIRIHTMRRRAYNVYKKEYTVDTMVNAFAELLETVDRKKGRELCSQP